MECRNRQQRRRKYIIKNAVWNQNIAVGGSAEFGFSGQESFPGFPKKYALLGNIAGVAEEDYSITYRLDSDWGDGFTGTISIVNNTDYAIEDWYLEFDFKRNITNIWNGVTESHKGNRYVIKNAGYNANINAGQMISFGFSGNRGSSADEPTNYELSSHAQNAKANPKYTDTDGDVNYYQSTIDKCIAGGIQIYAVNVCNASTHATLQKMTEQTGGEYYYASTVDQLETVFATVIGATVLQIDPTDVDGDGLYDIFETAGMRLPNGRIIFTDAANPDTDGDGLTDYQETGIVYNVDKRYIGNGQSSDVTYFQMRSYPDQKDSDGDGLTDNVDDRPLMVDFSEVAKLNSRFSDHYFNVADSDNAYYGGNQGWWSDKAQNQGNSGSLVGQVALKEDDYYRLWKMGCGTIAMSDAELYMAIQNDGYSLSVPATLDASVRQYGFCSKPAYMNYIEGLYDKKYRISGDIANRNVGLYPWQMEGGFSDFLSANGNPNTNVTWARYSGETYDKQKQAVVNEIENMLNKDIPVVFAYHTSQKEDAIRLYTSLENAKNGIVSATDKIATSHYMTVIGLYKYAGDQPLQYKYILEVVSWGNVYYIDYNMYANKLGYFSNVLSVY